MLIFASFVMMFAAGFVFAIAFTTDSKAPEVKVSLPKTLTVRIKKAKTKKSMVAELRAAIKKQRKPHGEHVIIRETKKPEGIHALNRETGKLNYPTQEQGCEV